MSDYRDPSSEMKPTDFEFIQIGIASPELILEWSNGEVTKPETINYRSFKPEKDGLFCERIFGPVKDWECHCGRYKRIRYRGVVCKHCKVEVTLSRVRRERMGHIKLAVPVAHIWFFKSLPSRIGNLLDMTITDLEKILYYASYIILEPGSTSYKPKQLISVEEYTEIVVEEPEDFLAMTGAEAIKKMLQEIDIEDLSRDLRVSIKQEKKSQHRKKTLLKKLKVVEAFRMSDNKPEWMIIDVVPVIPPDLRPLVPLEGGRFATSDLNDLYRRVINRNNRLKKLMEMKAPEVILRNERRMLQEAVDALFDNSRKAKAVRGRGKRPLKSLSDMLKGKQGRFRQNLLGKRVDYSGRSVIVVGPELELHQCGIPKVMALELFKPFIIRKLEEKGYVQTVKSAKKLVEKESPEVWEILEEIIKDHPVLLNRAPTLHRLGIQAFEPVLVEGKAIRIHPLVCSAFNADFDGDQMAVHIPLSFEAQLEARVLMMSTNNILLPANGKPVTAPTQDIIMGCYFLTKAVEEEEEEKTRSFMSVEEVLLAYNNGYVGLHTLIKLRKDGKIYRTTPGRIIFNQVVPEELGYVNEQMDKGTLEDLVFEVYRKSGIEKAVRFLDQLKDLGFEYATRSGASVGMDDIIIPGEKQKILDETNKKVDKIARQYRDKVITDGERYNRVIDTWTHTSTHIANQTFEELKDSQNGFNPLWMMIDSGARGSRDQVRQLAGMRGLMAKPQKKITGQVGEIIESPIKSNFREGLSVLEYFISTHGARKGLADTALKTADAGYLTRRLVDVTQDVTITIDDCQTVRGLDVTALKEGEEIIEPLKDRIVGSVALDDVKDPMSKDIIIKAGEEITLDMANRAEDSGVEEVKIRSVLTCEAKRGLCRKCYGRNLSTLKPVDIGEAVGIVAAQSIGEPGTQLTLRTFHIGGTAGRIAVQTEKTSPTTGEVDFKNVEFVEREILVEGIDGRMEKKKVHIVTGKDGVAVLKDKVIDVEVGDLMPKKIIVCKEDIGGELTDTKLSIKEKTFELSIKDGKYIGKKRGVSIKKDEILVEVRVAKKDVERFLKDEKIADEKGLLQTTTGNLCDVIVVSRKDVNFLLKIRVAVGDERKDFQEELNKGKRKEEERKLKSDELILKVNVVARTKMQRNLAWRESRERALHVPYGAELEDSVIHSHARKTGTVKLLDSEDSTFNEVEIENEFGIEKMRVVTVDSIEVKDESGKVRTLNPRIRILDKNGRKIDEYKLPRGAHLLVSEKDMVREKEKDSGRVKNELLFWAGKGSTVLFRWDPYSTPILTDKSGKVKFMDILEEVTMREEPDKLEGHKVKVIIEDRDKAKHPHIQILDKAGRKIRDYAIPTGAQLQVQDGQHVEAGEVLVKLSREMYKTRDITGGLPRVAELFEARRPKDPAIITEVDGRVKFGEIVRGNRQLIVEPDKGAAREYLIPHGKHLLVHEGDVVKAGDRLSEGPVNPHDILKIKGPNEVQEYLLNEVQEVYRLQGVKIHDKHIGVIVRQMLQKVKITDPGDTIFLEDEHVDKTVFQEENEKIAQCGGDPAKAEPLLLGITKASLTTKSFISAASFQETTRVLTEAAVRGTRDNLLGLKENIIIGHLIPAGTGSLKISNVKFPELTEADVLDEETEGDRVEDVEDKDTKEKTKSKEVVV